MKSHIKLLIPVLVTLLCVSCQKNQSEPGCNINGYWYGNWESNTRLQGTFIAGVEQISTDIEGNADIFVNSDNPVGYYPEYNGTVKDMNIRIFMDIGSIDVIVKGYVDNETVKGEFNLPDIAMQGTFSGQMLPSTGTSVTKIFTYSPSSPGERVTDMLCIENKLWLFIYPYEFVNKEAMLKTIITDLDGNIETTSHFPYDGYSYAYDGQYIWSIFNGTDLYKYDINGNRLDTIKLQFGANSLIGYGQNLYFPTNGYRGIIKTDLATNIIDTITFGYGIFPSMVYNNSFLSNTLNAILQFDNEGNIQHAYTVKDLNNVSKLVTNQDKIWALAEEDFEPEEPKLFWDNYVYKIELH